MTCICENCKHLKTNLEFIDNEETFVDSCDFGFPSETCESCVLESEIPCTLTCVHYEAESVENNLEAVHCTSCGKALQIDSNNIEVGAIYCPLCYLNQNSF